ncbi:MAG: hypothetical protein IJH98_10510 [Solobacterium sp.]|nr:hypothetical protein [Solobacterium sp.]
MDHIGTVLDRIFSTANDEVHADNGPAQDPATVRILAMYEELIRMHREDIEKARRRLRKAHAANRLDAFLYALDEIEFSENRLRELERQYNAQRKRAGHHTDSSRMQGVHRIT